MKQLITIFSAVLILLLATGITNNLAAQKDSITRVILLRHAEKADDSSKDPNLSDIGKNRASALAKLLSKTAVDAIYSTPYKRTRETVGALSAQKGITIEPYNPMDMQAVHSLVQNNKGKSLVFVGHSNTVPLILNALTKTSLYKNLPESEFDNIWILFLKGEEFVELLQLSY